MPQTEPSVALSSRITLTAGAITGLVFTLALAYSYHLYSNDAVDSGAKSTGLQRTGAIRRPRRAQHDEPRSASQQSADERSRQGVDGAAPETASAAVHVEEEAENVTEQSVDDPDAEEVARNPGTESKLKELTYFIAQNKEIEDGIVHRGITCDSCRTLPIRGVRYRCANCEDYDLCELCEATSEHVRTHVFYKMWVPCFWGPGKAQPVWFPGQPSKMPRELPNEVLQQLLRFIPTLGAEFVPDESQIKGWYQQYSCIADEAYSAADVEHGMSLAISRKAFRYFLPVTVRGALAFNRLFAIFDTDNDDLISFKEFVRGAILVNNRKNFPSWRQVIFRALDLDGDGCVSRDDLLQLYDSMHEIAEDVTLCHLKLYNESDDQRFVEERRTLRDFADSTRAIPNFFSAGYFDQLHLHRSDGPIFGQLAGRSNDHYRNSDDEPFLDDDDDDDKIGEGGANRQMSMRPSDTPAAVFIRNKLRQAFHKMLDPIFSEVDRSSQMVHDTSDVRKRHAALLRELQEFGFRLIRESNTNTSKPARSRTPSFVWQEAANASGVDLGASCRRIATKHCPTEAQIKQLVDDLVYVRNEAFAAGVPGSEKLFDKQEASVWNPCFRPDSGALYIVAEVLVATFEILINHNLYEQDYRNAEQIRDRSIDADTFWHWIDLLEEEQRQAERAGNLPPQHPLSMLDVLGLVVI